MKRDSLPSQSESADAPAPARAHKPTLLVVDDEPANLRLLAYIFGADCKVVAAASGEQALALCAASAPDLVLLDVVMPGMNGHTVCERLKANPLTQHIPVIFVTAEVTAEEETRCFALGAADFITKPINAAVGRARVRLQLTLLRQHAQQQAHIESLSRSRAQVEATARVTSEFLATMSHELRTPLNSIRGFAELIEMRTQDPLNKHQAQLIGKAADHLTLLLSEVLDIAKIEAGAMPLVPKAVDVRRAVHDVAALFHLNAKGKSLELGIHVADDVPQWLMLDSLRLTQILNNLLSNAFKFTPHGGVYVEAEQHEQRVLIHVRDTGPGVPPQARSRIFEKFRQASAETSHEHGGTGLGLALSRNLAELMGGTLVYTGGDRPGARFTLTLPMDVPHELV